MVEGQDIYNESKERPSTSVASSCKKTRALQPVSFSSRNEDSTDNFEEMAIKKLRD